VPSEGFAIKSSRSESPPGAEAEPAPLVDAMVAGFSHCQWCDNDL